RKPVLLNFLASLFEDSLLLFWAEFGHLGPTKAKEWVGTVVGLFEGILREGTSSPGGDLSDGSRPCPFLALLLFDGGLPHSGSAQLGDGHLKHLIPIEGDPDKAGNSLGDGFQVHPGEGTLLEFLHDPLPHLGTG